ncbi:hypothetical protein Tco_1567825 [Tanacetum coccineum]
MPELIRDGLSARMVMEHRDDAGVVVFTSRAWGRLFDTRGPLVRELILVFLSTLRFGERSISTDGDFLGPPPSYTLIRDPVLRLFHRMMAHSIAGRSQAPEKDGRKSGAHISGGQFVARLAEHFGLLTTEAWVAIAPERQPDTAAGAPVIAEDVPAVDEGDQAIPAPVQPPQQPPPPPPTARTMPQRMARLEEDVHEIRGKLTE